MCIPQNRLLRHVPGPQTPPQRHVHPPGPPTATCTRPADPASATCVSPRTAYCDMYPARRLRLSDMCIPQDHLLRHVTCQPIRLQRHVPPAGPATATCDWPAGFATATCSGCAACQRCGEEWVALRRTRRAAPRVPAEAGVPGRRVAVQGQPEVINASISSSVSRRRASLAARKIRCFSSSVGSWPCCSSQ